MKNFTFTSLLLFVLLCACSKDARINRKLEGNWKMKSVNGIDLPNQFYTERTFVFEKMKNKTGRVTIQTKVPIGQPYNFFGTYTLSQRGELFITATDDLGVPLTLHYKVDRFSNESIRWHVVASGVEEELNK